MVVLAQHHRLVASDLRAYYNTRHAFGKARSMLCSELVDSGVPEEGMIPLSPPIPHLPEWMRSAPEREVWALAELERVFPSNTTNVALGPKAIKVKAPFVSAMIQSITDAGYGKALSVAVECEEAECALKLAGLYDVYMDLRMQEEAGYVTREYSIVNKLGIPVSLSDKAIYATGAGMLGAVMAFGIGWYAVKREKNQGNLNRLADDILRAEKKSLRRRG